MRLNDIAPLALALLAAVQAHSLNPPQQPDDPANPKPPAAAPAPPASPPAPAPAQPPAPASAPATETSPASSPATESKARKSAPTKPAKGNDSGDDEEQPSNKAPHRFIPTEKGKADEDIPFPVDI
jgi:hypothetical protein